MKRFLLFMTAALPFFAALLIQYIVVNSCMILYQLYLTWSNGKDPGNVAGDGSGILASTLNEMPEGYSYLVSVIAVAVCGVIFFFWYQRETLGEVHGSYKSVLKGKYPGLFILLAIGCQFFFSGLMNIVTPLFQELFNDYSATMQTLTSGNIFVVLLLMAVVAPISEELVFRGVIMHIASRYVTFLGANMLQAVFFGLYHGNIIQGIYAAFLGFLLGMIYQKFQSIYAPILLHVLINISSNLMVLFSDTMVSYVVSLIVGMVCTVISLYFIKPGLRVTVPAQENTL